MKAERNLDVELGLWKLSMLDSLARSERALARILESVADVAAESPETARGLTQHADSIAKYQQQLAHRIAGLLPGASRKRSMRPAPPWLCGAIKQAGSKLQTEQKDAQ